VSNTLAQDLALIHGTTLSRLLQTPQAHKIAWLEQIRLAWLAYTTKHHDSNTDTDTEEDVLNTAAPATG
jgi:hypothetical protein